MKRFLIVTLTVMLLAALGGCRSYERVDTDSETSAAADDIRISEEPEMLTFVAAHGGTYTVEIDPDIEKHTYDPACFKHYGDILAYTGDPHYYYRLGVDVSYYQGDIDWEAVRDAGFEFAFIRLGFRGYGRTGTLNIDQNFYENMKGASDAGLDIGVYFFAQAVNEEEAIQEAEFVLEILDGTGLDLPIVYDPETVFEAEARTDDVTGEQFTANTISFCERVKEAGYDGMVYCNMLWEAFTLDLKELSDYLIWYADYEPAPQTPYRFEYWQYTSTASVNGIKGDVDLNIQMIPMG